MIAVQSFAHYARNCLRNASPIIAGMEKSLAQIVAANVKAAREERKFVSHRALAAAAQVAPNSVKNLENPRVRAHADKGEASPRLDILHKVAHAMGFSTWHMLLENFDPKNPPPQRPPSAREMAVHYRIQEEYRKLDKQDFDGND